MRIKTVIDMFVLFLFLFSITIHFTVGTEMKQDAYNCYLSSGIDRVYDDRVIKGAFIKDNGVCYSFTVDDKNRMVKEYD